MQNIAISFLTTFLGLCAMMDGDRGRKKGDLKIPKRLCVSSF